MAQLPQDYDSARANIFTDSKVDTLIRQHGSSPRFVYGPLVLPTVLKYYTDSPKSYPMEKYMTKATLHGYELYQIAEKSVPVIARSANPDAIVKGMVVFNLGDSERNDISELEICLKHLEAVQVEIECMAGKKPKRFVDAGTFVWSGSVDGLIRMYSASWDPTSFVNSSFYRNIRLSVNRSSKDTEGS
ncbi:uncharacterized protein N7496_007345 [Penicillium cataractarum]|uniref:Putative gamma-glutamylcyclotransferase n=1 Tax=Penicillium cataractarum TaxID=2100454 RepID=A0A9W9S3A5_9EURO|nr:uncharacterized protein N7496_007345 [Penicillium cataractarum]KAJ5371253.1 hypothetical protein N7496_007345 [Penicillium cataractarum]